MPGTVHFLSSCSALFLIIHLLHTVLPFCVLYFYPTLIWLDFTVKSLFSRRASEYCLPGGFCFVLFFYGWKHLFIAFYFNNVSWLLQHTGNQIHSSFFHQKDYKIAGRTKDANREGVFYLRSGTAGSSPLKEFRVCSCHHHCQSQKRKETFLLPIISDKKTILRCSKLKL